ncbi:hypothetical protein WA026_012673 [Henosepilachna vigintioctopunctata]|uniref:Reverse transcriptase domain-containing protein n=1 Tax=Henosepilachna vigintioctopunctata TaxID=420089 RepID=A0AAW1U0E5_9CUCU
MILLYKKGDAEDLRNYSPISLLPTAYNILMKIITNCLSRQLDSCQPIEQAGFRKPISTMDHIFTMREVISRCNEYAILLYMAFIDYKKEFDLLRTLAATTSLLRIGIPSCYTELIQNIYEHATATIKIDEYSEKMPIMRGVRQGDPFSPKLFAAALECMF